MHVYVCTLAAFQCMHLALCLLTLFSSCESYFSVLLFFLLPSLHNNRNKKSIWTPRLGHGHKGDACVFATTKDFILQKVRSFVLSAGYRIHGSFSFVALLRTITTKWIVYKWVWQGKWKASRVFVCVCKWVSVLSLSSPTIFSTHRWKVTGQKGYMMQRCDRHENQSVPVYVLSCTQSWNDGKLEERSSPSWKSLRAHRANMLLHSVVCILAIELCSKR